MPNYTSASVKPHLARLLLHAANYEMASDDVSVRLEKDLVFSDYDLFRTTAGLRWKHRLWSAVSELRARGIIEFKDPQRPSIWRLMNPVGVAWAREVAVLHAGTMERDFTAIGAGAAQPRQDSELPEESYLAYQPDARVRKAVEIRALELAEEEYKKQYTMRRVGKPYDLECVHTKTGKHRHVEVKGFQDEDPPTAVLTRGEVKHVRKKEFPVDLAIAVGISVLADGEAIEGTGGVIAWLIKDWEPLEEALDPTQYEYRLPAKNVNRRR